MKTSKGFSKFLGTFYDGFEEDIMHLYVQLKFLGYQSDGSNPKKALCILELRGYMASTINKAGSSKRRTNNSGSLGGFIGAMNLKFFYFYFFFMVNLKSFLELLRG